MRDEDFREWLVKRGGATGTVRAYVTDARRVEKRYDDLDALYAKDRLEELIKLLRYTAEDERDGKPNPSKIEIRGKLTSLAGYRNAVKRYQEFRDEDGGGEEPIERVDEETGIEDRLFGLERDLQQAMRESIATLEKGLTIIDDGLERRVDSGFIDITARGSDGAIVVIELKAGTAKRDAVGQILSYMGDIERDEDNDVRCILVAGDFDHKTVAAAQVVPGLTLRRYSVSFKFEDIENAKDIAARRALRRTRQHDRSP